MCTSAGPQASTTVAASRGGRRGRGEVVEPGPDGLGGQPLQLDVTATGLPPDPDLPEEWHEHIVQRATETERIQA